MSKPKFKITVCIILKLIVTIIFAKCAYDIFLLYKSNVYILFSKAQIFNIQLTKQRLPLTSSEITLSALYLYIPAVIIYLIFYLIINDFQKGYRHTLERATNYNRYTQKRAAKKQTEQIIYNDEKHENAPDIYIEKQDGSNG